MINDMSNARFITFLVIMFCAVYAFVTARLVFGRADDKPFDATGRVDRTEPVAWLAAAVVLFAILTSVVK